MTDATRGRPAGEPILHELEATLAREVELARNDDFDALHAAMDQAAELIARAGEIPLPLSEEAVRCLERIRRLEDRLHLAMHAKRDTVLQDLGRANRGRRGVSAYRQDAPRERPGSDEIC